MSRTLPLPSSSKPSIERSTRTMEKEHCENPWNTSKPKQVDPISRCSHCNMVQMGHYWLTNPFPKYEAPSRKCQNVLIPSSQPGFRGREECQCRTTLAAKDFVCSCVLSVLEANGGIQSGVGRNDSLVCLRTCNAGMSAMAFSNSQNMSPKLLQSATTIRTYNGITMALIQNMERVTKDGLSKDVKRTSIATAPQPLSTLGTPDRRTRLESR